MTRWITAVAAALAISVPLRAQEVGAFSTVTLPNRSYWPATYGLGVSLAGFFRLGAIAGSNLPELKASPIRVGLRVVASEHRGTLKDGSMLRMGTYQASAMVRPTHSPLSRFEIGGGVAGYTVRSSFRDAGWSLTGTIGLSRRAHERSSMWASIAYDIHREMDRVVAADASSAHGIIAHTVRLAVAFKLGARD